MREDTIWINALNNFLTLLTASGDLKTLQDKWLKSRAWFDQLP